jgi:hypothetical protein
MAPIKINVQTIVAGIVGALSISGSVVFSPCIRRWYSHWGATKNEIKRQLSGDDLVPFPKIVSTRAVTVRGQAKDIWPWLVQVGYRRAGWYSYDILDIVTGAGEFVDGLSSRRIVPDLQLLEPGSQIYMHPRIPAYTVDRLVTNSLIVLVIRIDAKTGNTYSLLGKRPSHFINCTRVYFLEKLNDRETRLIVRSRLNYSSSFLNTVLWKVLFDPGSFIMERKMLLEIKKRVESLNQPDWRAARRSLGIK